jgi:hypothetical protein
MKIVPNAIVRRVRLAHTAFSPNRALKTTVNESL